MYLIEARKKVYLAIYIADVHVSMALFDKHLHNCSMIVNAREDEGGVIEGPRHIHISTMLDQREHGVLVAIMRCEDQGRVAVVVGRVDVSSALHEKVVDGLGVAVLCREDECVIPVDVPSVHIRPFGYQQRHDVHEAMLCSREECDVVGVVADVHRGPVG